MWRTEFKGTTETRQRALFYKCPVGGFASLVPGRCPKCNEHLLAFPSSDDVKTTEKAFEKSLSLLPNAA